MATVKVNHNTSNTQRWTCQKCTYSNRISNYPKCRMCKQTDGPLINTSSPSSDRDNITSTSLAIHDRQTRDEINANRLFNDIITYCRKNKIHFVDDQFPPIERSIGNINQSFQWLKISELKNLSNRINHSHLKWRVYSSPEPNDIQQGQLGDCWFMAALALITERPQMLEHIVLTREINNEGVYLIRLCHNGIWKIIIIDDCFPCRSTGELAFTKANRYQLYVPLIEKACAKLFGSYADLIGGQTEEGLQLLTGAPCEHINLEPNDSILDKDIIWAKLLSACESNLLIGAGTSRTDITEEQYDRQHLQINHAYSILAAYFLSNLSMQFVLLRDPHGRTDYHEDLITSQVLQRLNSILRFRLPSGAFWISWPMFLKYFSSITISSYSNDLHDIREIGTFTRSSIEPIPTFQFYISKTTSVNISLIYHRKYRQIKYLHTQSFLLCNIADKSLNNYNTDMIMLETSRGSFTHWSGILKPGFYILIPFSTSFWAEKYAQLDRTYTLVIHSKNPINGHFLTEPALVLTDCLIAYCLKEYKKISKYSGVNYYVTNGRSNLFIFVAENSSSTDYLHFDLDMSEGIHIRNSRQSLITHDCIPPKHRQIIFVVEWANEVNQLAQLDYVYRHSHVKRPNNSLPAIDILKNDFHSYRSF